MAAQSLAIDPGTYGARGQGQHPACASSAGGRDARQQPNLAGQGMSAAERKGAALELFAKALAANDDGTTHGAAAPPDDVREILENMDRMTPAQRARLARLAEILSEATDRATGQAVGRELD